MTGATRGGGTSNSSEVRRRVLLVERELSNLQKQNDGCYEWIRHCPLFRSNATGDTSGGRTDHSLEVRRRVLQVENEPFISNTTGATSGGGAALYSEVTRQVLLVKTEIPTDQKEHDG